MDTKKRNMIIGAGVAAAVILIVGLLAAFGVFRGFNPEGYVKAVLDQSLKGEVKVAAQLMDGATEDALYKQYEAGITSFVENSIANGVEMDEELKGKYVALCKKVFAAMGREAVLFMAYLEDTPIAGTIGVYSGGKGWYLYGASSNSHRNAMPNYLLQWEMVRMALERHCVFYDFRGVPGELTEENPLYGLYRFKKGFGGTYTKFMGLFVRSYRPVLSRCFDISLQIFRLLRVKCRCR